MFAKGFMLVLCTLISLGLVLRKNTLPLELLDDVIL